MSSGGTPGPSSRTSTRARSTTGARDRHAGARGRPTARTGSRCRRGPRWPGRGAPDPPSPRVAGLGELGATASRRLPPPGRRTPSPIDVRTSPSGTGSRRSGSAPASARLIVRRSSTTRPSRRAWAPDRLEVPVVVLVDAVHHRRRGRLDDRERGLHLVRGILEEPASRRLVALEIGGHRVERPAERADLVAPARQARAGRQVARARRPPRSPRAAAAAWPGGGPSAPRAVRRRPPPARRPR